MKDREVRFLSETIEIRKAEDGSEGRTVEGYALTFGKWSEDLGWGFREKINKKALEGVSLSGVIATFNHDFSMPLARVDAKSLKLSVDDTGLRFEFTAPETTYGNDLLINIRNGNVKGCSVMFTVGDEKWVWRSDPEKMDEREILKFAEIIELGPVTMPAYKSTSVSARSREDVVKEFAPEPTIDNRQKIELIDLDMQMVRG